MKVDEAIRTVRLKLEVRKQDVWSPGMVFWAEIQEVETLIAEVERLRSQVADLEGSLKDYDRSYAADKLASSGY
jgi:hypothetical protein